MTWGMALILLSIIAIPSLFLSKEPNAVELLEKTELYQGLIGLGACLFGILGIVDFVLEIEKLHSNIIWYVSLLIGNITSIILGFMLGCSLINKILFTNSLRKARIIRSKLAPKQGKLGIIGFFIGTWVVIASFLFL